MLQRVILLMPILLAARLFAGQDAPKPAPTPAPLTHEERSNEFLIAIEKLRTLPRPGDIQNAGMLANIGDVIETTPEQKTLIAAEMKAYEAAMVKKAAQFEAEMNAARAEAEARIIAQLPEARREAAKKALDYSHAQWTPPLDFEARLRADFLQRKEKAEDKTLPAEELDALRKEFAGWLRTQRANQQQKNAETAKTIKSYFDAKEVERLNEFDKNREVAPTPPKVKKVK